MVDFEFRVEAYKNFFNVYVNDILIDEKLDLTPFIGIPSEFENYDKDFIIISEKINTVFYYKGWLNALQVLRGICGDKEEPLAEYDEISSMGRGWAQHSTAQKYLGDHGSYKLVLPHKDFEKSLENTIFKPYSEFEEKYPKFDIDTYSRFWEGYDKSVDAYFKQK